MGTEDTSEFASASGAVSEGQSRLIREEKLSVQGYVAIKGTRNGLLLTLEPETPFNELLNALAERLAEAPGFFRGASLSVDTSRRRLRVSERIQLERLLASYQMSVMPLELVRPPRAETATESVIILPTQPLADTVMSGTPDIESKTGMPPTVTNPSGPLREESPAARETRDARESTNTLFLRRTVRSGQAIHHDSTIVVLGDVNPGAEIVAGGDIIVWGVLRGMVHAGYPGNEQALVCALQLAPVQLRIAHLLSRPPEGMDAQQLPEVAGIRNGRIVVETWLNGRPPRK